MKIPTVEIQPQQIVSRLRDRAASYFPALRAGFSVRLRNVNRRAFATLYEVEINDGRDCFDVFVKETARPEAVNCNASVKLSKSIPERFRPMPDPKGYERAALSAIDRHFSALSDPRFGTVRVLDEWFDGWAFVMERVPHPPLSRVLPRTMRGSIRQLELGPAFYRAGAWLREFHGSRPPDHTRPAGNPADRFIEDLAALHELLKACGETCGPFHAALDELSELAAGELPSGWPVGLAHGDFAPRNVLVSRTNVVTVIDTLAEQMAAVHEDLAHFLVHLKTHKLQMLGRGLPFPERKLAANERAFLSGYFGKSEIPWRTIRLFEAKTLVARRAALQLNCRTGGKSLWLKQAAYVKWGRPFFAGMMRQLLEELGCRRSDRVSGTALAAGLKPVDCHREKPAASALPLKSQKAESSSVVERLIRRSGSYFDDLDAETAVIVPEAVRENRFSTIYSASIVAGTTSHRVIAKVPRDSDRNMADARVDDRPRLAPLMMPHEEAEREYAALLHIHQHMSSRNSAVLRSVRPLGFCPRDAAVILEAVDAPTLDKLLQRDAKGDGNLLTETLSNAGRWLRCLHELPPTVHSRPRDVTRHDYLANVARFSAFLGTHGVDASFLQNLEDSLLSVCAYCLPDRLPLGLSHGDFAPHNMFAYEDGAVAAFDTLGQWEAPIYEDIAHFLYLLKEDADRPQWTEFDARESAFLAAYFGSDPVPECAVLAFLLLIVLDKWVSAIQGVRRAAGLKRLAKRMLMPGRHRRFHQAVEQLLAGIRERVEGATTDIVTGPTIERFA